MTGAKTTVALLAGGISAERDVSLKSGEQVFRAIDKSRYNVRRFDPKDDLARLASEADSIDVALIILHGRLGEDGKIQGFLDCLGIPYQGSGVLGSAIAMNKILSKKLYSQAGLPVAPWAVADRAGFAGPTELVELLGESLVIKPEHEGSSIGLSIVHKAEDLMPALHIAWEYDRRCLVEQYIPGVEITCGVLGNNDPIALPLVEIIPGEQFEFFDYKAKYTPGASHEICPARISTEATRKAQDFGKRSHEALHCRGYSRTDMIVSGDDQIYVLETNTIPGMTETSLFPQSAAAAGIDFTRLLDRLIELAMEKQE